MAAEHDNLRAALEYGLAAREGDTALEMAGALWFFWFACGFPKEGQHYLDRALALDPSQTPGPVRAKALWGRGIVAIAQGDTVTSLRFAAAFRAAVAGETDETAPIGAAYLEGSGLTLRGRHAQAAEVLDAARPPRSAGGRYYAAWFLARAARAFVQVHLGRFARAVAVADEVCDDCARRGETWVRAWGDYMRALATLGLGRTEEAAAHARTAIEGKRRLHDSLGIAMAIDLLASAAVAAGRAEQAARLLGVARQIWQTIGTPQLGSPELIAARQACEERARRLVGDDAYQTAFHVGYDADLETGIAYALDQPPIADHPVAR